VHQLVIKEGSVLLMHGVTMKSSCKVILYVVLTKLEFSGQILVVPM